MRSRALRTIIGALAWIVIGASAFFLNHLEQTLSTERAALRTFDARAREITDAIADLRASQEAYVAAGQGLEFWLPRVRTSLDTLNRGLAELATGASSVDSRSALVDAASALASFAAADSRARDYLKSEEPLMASDVVFTEGGEDAVTTARHVERARLAEQRTLDAVEGGVRRQEMLAVVGAAALAALAVLLLVPVRSSRAPEPVVQTETPAVEAPDAKAPARTNPEPPPAAPESHVLNNTRGASPVLRAAAELCTEFGSISTLEDLKRLLGRAADMMDASGLVVWMGRESGTELHPVLAHGYGPQALARIPVVPRSADNAAAAAYRTGSVQVVTARSGEAARGAIVVPILATGGCVGALSAEIRGGGESSDAVQALATIVAAQLAGVLALPGQPDERAAVI